MKRKKTGWLIWVSGILTVIILLGLGWRRIQMRDKISAARKSLPVILDSIRKNGSFSRQTSLVVCFVSTDCDHCQALCAQLAPRLAVLENVQLVLITDQNRKLTNEFVRQFGLATTRNLVILPDSLGFWKNRFGVRSLPTTWVYDKQKVLKKSFIGEVEIDNVLKVVR